MIVGVGTDIVSVARVQGSHSRLGDAFAQRILTPQELLLFRQRHEKSAERGYRFLANRFAAKEALSKACGTGIRDCVVWQNIQVLNDSNGKPVVELLHELGIHALEQRWSVHVSLSDESDHAVAFVVIEQN